MQHPRVTVVWLFVALTTSSSANVLAEPRKPEWPSSEFHGKLDGNGNPIPCRCLFRGQSFRLGQSVCMNTYKGQMIAECDLAQNTTTWVPTGVPCTSTSLGNSLGSGLANGLMTTDSQQHARASVAD
jgi:hypothetical protein